MTSFAVVRKTLGNWISGKRAAPITFAPELGGVYLGTGIGSNQPDHQTLLRENQGVPDISTRTLANRISTLNPQVKTYVRSRDGKRIKEVLDDHVCKLLLDKPHEDFTRRQMLRLLTQYIVSTGEGYLLKIRNGLGVPAALQPLPSQHVDPIIKGGLISAYTVRDGKGQVHRLDKREIVRCWFPDPETLYEAEGYLGPNATVTDTQRFATEHLRNHYQNNAMPPFLLEPGPDAIVDVKELEKWQADFERKYHQIYGTHRGLPGLLPGGWKAVAIAIASGKDVTPLLEFLQSNQFMNFGIPPSVLGRVVSGDRSSAETNDWVMDKHAVLPIAEMIADALSQQLAPDFDNRIFIEFEDFVAEDKEFKLRQEDQDAKNKIRSGKQIIEDRGGDPERAPWAELPVGTIADVPYTGEDLPDLLDDDASAFEIDDDDDAEDEENADRIRQSRSRKNARPGATSNARGAHFSPEKEWARVIQRERKWRPKMERALKSIFNAQRKEVIRQLEALEADEDRTRALTVDEVLIAKRWSKLFAARIDPIRKAAFIESANQALAGIGFETTFEFNAVVAERLGQYGELLEATTAKTTIKRLKKAMAATDQSLGVAGLKKTVDEVFGGRRRNAATIARTELLRATQDAQLEGFKQSDVVEYKRWNDNGDADVRDSHYGSLIAAVKINAPFTLANGASAMFPGDPTLAPGDSINCRCFLTPEFDDPEGINE